MAEPAPDDEAAGGTRLALILAGERLFAEHGVDAVSLRQINMAAGQRNASAAHYHFGSRQALIGAVYAYRMERVNRRIRQQLERLPAAAGLRRLVEAVIQPLVEEIDADDSGRHFIRCHAQIVARPRPEPEDQAPQPDGAALAEALPRLRAALPHLPAPVLERRLALIWIQSLHALAVIERCSDGVTLGADGFVGNLIDMAAGALAAPLSTETRRALG